MPRLDRIDQLELYEHGVLLERLRSSIETPMGLVTADRIIEGQHGIIGAAGVRGVEGDAAFEPKEDQALYKVHAVGKKVAEECPVAAGDVVIMNGLIRNITMVKVGTKEFGLLWWEPGMLLARAHGTEDQMPEEPAN